MATIDEKATEKEQREMIGEVKGDFPDAAVDEDRRRCEKRLVRKLDMTLMPIVWTLYLFNYLGMPRLDCYICKKY